MLLLITGGAGTGKSAYAAKWAEALGREAIRLNCPPFPDAGMPEEKKGSDHGRTAFSWMDMTAGDSLASTLRLINRQSNIYRADQRVLIVDSLSGWLRAWAARAADAGWQPGTAEPAGGDSLLQVLEAIILFQGKRIIVAEETALGLSPDPWDKWYAYQLAAAVRRLAEESHSVYRLTAGMAVEVKGYRVKRGKSTHEHLYTDRG